MRTELVVLIAVGMLVAVALCAGVGDRPYRPMGETSSAPATSRPSDLPADSMEYWLRRAKPAATQETTDPSPSEPRATVRSASLVREDAVPGVVVLSDGRILPGWLHTTRGKPWLVFEERTRRWRRIPFAAALSITAVVVSERTEPQWRWKATGVPERVYTGRTYPTRRLMWRFRLADGSEIIGAVKGQPLWIVQGENPTGPFVLHERQKGTAGQLLSDLPYVRKVFVSRRLMGQVLGEQARPASQPPADLHEPPARNSTETLSVIHCFD